MHIAYTVSCILQDFNPAAKMLHSCSSIFFIPAPLAKCFGLNINSWECFFLYICPVLLPNPGPANETVLTLSSLAVLRADSCHRRIWPECLRTQPVTSWTGYWSATIPESGPTSKASPSSSSSVSMFHLHFCCTAVCLIEEMSVTWIWSCALLP